MHLELGVMLAGLLVGFVVGLTGMGGGALMTPILVLLFRVNPLAAVSSDIVAAVVMKPVGGGTPERRSPFTMFRVRLLTRLAVATVVGVALLVPAGALGAGAAPMQDNVTLRLGYFPNVTHASAIVGVEGGIFQEKLGDDVKLDTSTFNAGPQAVEALNSGALDATYIGPNPAINAFAQSGGEAIRIISGATSGGAFLIVQPSIKSAKELKGKQVASPQLGNTQDVALRTWLKKKGLKTDTAGGGDLSILPQENAQTLDLFKRGEIDGAWVPEPWATRLVNEGGGKVLVDESTLWPKGQYVTTQLIVRTEFLRDHPDAVKRLLEGQVAANDLIKNDPAKAQDLVGQGINNATGKPLAPDVIAASFKNLTFTDDPIATSLRKSAKDAEAAGLLKAVDLKGIYDLKLLNQVLKKQGEPTVKS